MTEQMYHVQLGVMQSAADGARVMNYRGLKATVCKYYEIGTRIGDLLIMIREAPGNEVVDTSLGKNGMQLVFSIKHATDEEIAKQRQHDEEAAQ